MATRRSKQNTKKYKANMILSPYRKIKPIAALVIAVAAIAILIWAVFCFWKKNNSIKKITAEKKEIALNPSDPKEKLQKMAAIIKSENTDRCNELDDNELRTACVNNISLNLAKKKNDVRYCQNIDDKMIPIADCEREVILNQAIEKKDISICQLASDQDVKNQCQINFYPSLALFSRDINICSAIKETNQFEYCYNNFLVNEKFRKDIKGFDCLQLKGGAIQEDCRKMQSIIGTISNMSKYPDPDRCSQFQTSVFKQYCQGLL